MTDALSRGTDVILRLDVQGAATVRRLLPDAVSVFLVRLPTSAHRSLRVPERLLLLAPGCLLMHCSATSHSPLSWTLDSCICLCCCCALASLNRLAMRTLLVRVCGLDVSCNPCLVSRLPRALQDLPVEGAVHAAAVQAGIKAADEGLGAGGGDRGAAGAAPGRPQNGAPGAGPVTCTRLAAGGRGAVRARLPPCQSHCAHHARRATCMR